MAENTTKAPPAQGVLKTPVDAGAAVKAVEPMTAAEQARLKELVATKLADGLSRDDAETVAQRQIEHEKHLAK